MAKNKISEYSATAANNTDVANINIAEGCSPANVNNAIRGVMAHLKDFQAGNQTGNALAIAGGGTGAESASAARTNLGAASSGANSDITSLSGLTTPLSVAQGGSGAATLTGYLKGNGTSAFTAQATPIPVADGGTGATSLTANNVVLGNGTSAVQVVAPGTSGNVLTSNGTTWTSAAAATGITTTSGSANYYGIRAAVAFDGSGNIRGTALNISSVTSTGSDTWILTFTTAAPDTNYTAVATAETTADSNVVINSTGRATGSFRLTNRDGNNYQFLYPNNCIVAY